MSNLSFMDEYNAYCATHGVPERVETLLTDINAVLRGKWLPGDAADKLAKGAVRIPISTYALAMTGEEVEGTGLGIVVGDPDGTLHPIPGSLKPVPWADGHVAQVLVEMHDPVGQVIDFSPRKMLSDMLKTFAERDLRPVMATELEFYILQPRAAGHDAPQVPAHALDAHAYDVDMVARHEHILKEIISNSKHQSLPTDTLIAEYGPGQFEINFVHTSDVLAAAEMAVLFRRIVRMVVAQHGLEATFMAKPYAAYPGNGMHVHASLLDGAGQNVFAATEAEDIAPKLSHAVGGVLATMREFQAIFAPHMNSYRRFQPNSYAPTTPDWGFDNRAAAVRLPETKGPGARLEHRICGADVNPYLALTGILGGILYGLDHKPAMTVPLDDPKCIAADSLSHDWLTSLRTFEASERAKYVFGAEFCRIYAAMRQYEIEKLTSVITPVEYRYYLGRV